MIRIPFIDPNLLYQVNQIHPTSTDDYSINPLEVTLTTSRASVIPHNFVGHTISIHNGRTFIRTKIKESMVGHRLGEFVLTKHLGSSIHNSLRNRKKKEKMRRKITQKKIRKSPTVKKAQKAKKPKSKK
jgi:small subunit ribosomal protein S19